MPTDTGSSTEPKKTQKLNYTYRDKDGNVQDSFTEDSRSVITTVISNGKSVELSIYDVIPDRELVERIAADYPMAPMGFLMGVKTTVGNSVTVVKNGDAEEMHSALQTRRDTIVVDKEWRSDAGGGPRTGVVIEAFNSIAMREKGKPLNEAGIAQLKALIKEKGVKVFADSAVISAEIAALDLKKRQEALVRKQAAAEAAGGASVLSEFLDNIN